ncbi:unnamed protein product [Callosobruchus maculatus]|uniref:Major facilitator superfamily (MFS) profile domain-containing protein n=1 Tax=Callosobruchus maculatus TaxID=64391 RepID=A0A653BFM0_CALMS|nr:unnamed protein product [Callosobruchus maculatus]
MDSKHLTKNLKTYNWDNKGVILSSFFWGYFTLQAIAGELGNRYGTKWLLFIAMFVSSTASVLTPLMAQTTGSYGVIGCRVVQGMSQGFFFPSVSNLLGQWIPPSERSYMATIAYSGTSLGTIFAMPITGFLAASQLGWPSTFYLFGALGYLWILAWYFLGAGCPTEYPRITEEEKTYIQQSLSATQDELSDTPWWSIITSLPVWAVIVGLIGLNFGFTMLLTEMPTYLNKIHGISLKSNGVLSAMPYLVSFVFGNLYGIVCEHLITRGCVTRGTARKIFNSIGQFGPATALVVLAFLPKNAAIIAEAMLIVAVGTNTACTLGCIVSTVDLAPNYSGVIMGVANGIGQIFSIVAPLVVHFVVTNEEDQALWRTAFLTAAAVFITANLFFLLFSSGEVQPWNNAKTFTNNADTAKSEVSQ